MENKAEYRLEIRPHRPRYIHIVYNGGLVYDKEIVVGERSYIRVEEPEKIERETNRIHTSIVQSEVEYADRVEIETQNTLYILWKLPKDIKEISGYNEAYLGNLSDKT